MKYRCPYCKTILPDPPPATCPKCGHTMIPPPSAATHERHARERKIQSILTDAEKKKRALGVAPAISRGPGYYLGIVAFLVILAFAAFQFMEKPKPRRDAKIMHATASVNALATALGRFHFHTGVYPTATEGLAALASKVSPYPGWNGPYITHFRNDPWLHDYIYEPSTDGAPPVILSLGPDGVRGTADDIYPDTAEFFRPGEDTSWTNDWVPFSQRGIIVIPSKTK